MSVATDLAKRADSPQRKTIRDTLERYAPEIEKALPAQIGAERFTRIVLTELGRNPALYECSQESLVAACLLSAQLGLEPGPLGHVYLVPFKEKGAARVQFIIGYKGLVSLAYRSGEIKDIVARTVYEEESWSYSETQAGPRFSHSPLPPSSRGPARLWWGRARTCGGGAVVLVAYPEEIEARKNRSPAGRKGSGPWVTDYDAMARKTVIRMMWPSLPTSSILARSFHVDEAVVPAEAIEAESVEEVLPDWPDWPSEAEDA